MLAQPVRHLSAAVCLTLSCFAACRFGYEEAGALVGPGGGQGGDDASGGSGLGPGGAGTGGENDVILCGDGEVEGDEACDDGNTDSGDFCSPDCSVAIPGCGDDLIQDDEECDPGTPRAQFDPCQSDCTFNWGGGDARIRRRLVFDNSGQSETLVRFPVAVLLTTSVFDFLAAKPNGEDLRFFDSDDETPLSYEIEDWNVGGRATVWVSVPEIPGQENRDYIWMYYRNPSLDDGQDAASVFSDFAAVWHFDDGGTDATGTAQHEGTVTDGTFTSGKLGSSLALNGTTSHMAVPSVSSIENLFLTGATVSAWIRPNTFGQTGFGRILDKAADETGLSGWSFQLDQSADASNSNTLRFDTWFGATQGFEASEGAINLGVWQHVAVSFDGSANTNLPALYVDGLSEPVNHTDVAAGPLLGDDSGIALWTGNHAAGQNRAFSGAIDEVRVYKGIRSADWIRAEVLNANGNFVTFAELQDLPDN